MLENQAEQGNAGGVNIIAAAALAATLRQAEHALNGLISRRLIQGRKRCRAVAQNQFGFFGIFVKNIIQAD